MFEINIGSEGTVEFLKYFNTAFDIHNCDKEIETDVYKSPIKPETKRIIFNFLDEFIEYINGLRLNGSEITTTGRKTAFIGFKNNSIALKLMYEELVETKLIDKICTTDLQQDLLESFFSRMRSKGGFNSNPTLEQFCGNFRRILLNKELTASALSNCVDKLEIMHVSSSQVSQHKPDSNYLMQINVQEEDDEECEPLLEEEEEVFIAANEEISEMKASEILNAASLAGLIESAIQKSKRFSCEHCAMIFEMNIKIDSEYFVQNRKTVLPCRSTFEICSTSLAIMSKYFESVHISHFDYFKLFDIIKKAIDAEHLYVQSNFEHCMDHKSFIIDLLIEEIIKVKCISIARIESLEQHKFFVRSSKTHDIHFMGQ